jgi:hypothetical protein
VLGTGKMLFLGRYLAKIAINLHGLTAVAPKKVMCLNDT